MKARFKIAIITTLSSICAIAIAPKNIVATDAIEVIPSVRLFLLLVSQLLLVLINLQHSLRISKHTKQ